MENTRHNGLAGKARRARNLNRASRMYAQQMIEEYLYPESDSWRPERFIPVRSRSDFRPSPALFMDEPAAPQEPQLSLINLEAIHEPLPKEPSAERAESTPKPRMDSVIRPRKAPFQPMQRQKQKQSPFTPGGFLFGCALGSAAAAVVLFVVQLAVR